MPPRVLEILARLESIDLEGMALRKELREMLEAEMNEDVIQADFSMFKNSTYRLLTEFLTAPNHTLSYEDIRLDVIFDEDVGISAIRSLIKRARKEMRNCPDCLYEIRSIPRKGYKLERKKVSNCVKMFNNSVNKRIK